jgi:hypothetical protein
MRKTAITLCASALAVLTLGAIARPAVADGTYQSLPFSQNWSNAAAITVNDNWAGVPGIIGYLGDHDPGAPTGVDPTTLTGDLLVAVDVIANQVNPNTVINGGVGEFDVIADPVVALQGSGTADAPYLLLHLNTTGLQTITLGYNLRDIDGAAENSIQQVAAQYRVGNAGPWTNIGGTYVADASTGPSIATLVTPINVVLPAGAENVAQLQVRILTTNAIGSDEWIGVDDITVTGSPIPSNLLGVNLGWGNCGTTIATADRAFACNDNGTSFSLVGSYKNGFDVADFVAISAAVDVTTTGAATPAWFQFGPGGCREGELSLNNVGNIAGCTNPYSGANQGGGFIVENGPSPDRFRVRLDWARDIPGPLDGDVLNTAFVIGISSANSFDEGFGMCAGCNVPACFVLNAVEVFSQTQDRVRIIESADVRNYASWQGGSGSCPGATPSRKATWGQVKALYR